MKMILASSGLANEEIVAALEELVGKKRQDINVAIINEAIKGESGDMRWFADELAQVGSVLGGGLEFVDLQAHDMDYVRARIDCADMIFCFGGDSGYLADVFEATGFAKILPQILAEKVWVGSSAGSCVMCHRNAEIFDTVYKEKRGTSEFLEYVPIIFLPHLHGHYKFDQAEILHVSESTDLSIYAVSDNCALKIVDQEKPIVLGEDYLLAEQGKLGGICAK